MAEQPNPNGLTFIVDIEPTNRCNAKCHFCPRDQTPHQGLMSPEVFTQALKRGIEMQAMGEVRVNLCGLGEPLLNKHAPAFVAETRAAGISCGMSSNAALLDERRGRALLDAGLERIFINVGDRDEDYEDVYKLPFEKTRDNVERFAEMAGDACEVYIVLVNYRQSEEHLEEMRAFWRERGLIRFMQFEIMNRGGALFVDHMQYESYPEQAEAVRLLGTDGGVCGVPFNSVFIGYDGQFYLCCSDWKKEAPLGHVNDFSPFDIFQKKLEHVMSREPVCKTCNLDPVNRLTDKMREINAGEAAEDERDQMVNWIKSMSVGLVDGLNKLKPGISEAALANVQRGDRKLIPVTAL